MSFLVSDDVMALSEMPPLMQKPMQWVLKLESSWQIVGLAVIVSAQYWSLQVASGAPVPSEVGNPVSSATLGQLTPVSLVNVTPAFAV